MTKKERALIDQLETLIMDETFTSHCKSASGIIFLTRISNLIFKLKFPKLSKSDLPKIEIQ